MSKPRKADRYILSEDKDLTQAHYFVLFRARLRDHLLQHITQRVVSAASAQRSISQTYEPIVWVVCRSCVTHC